MLYERGFSRRPRSTVQRNLRRDRCFCRDATTPLRHRQGHPRPRWARTASPPHPRPLRPRTPQPTRPPVPACSLDQSSVTCHSRARLRPLFPHQVTQRRLRQDLPLSWCRAGSPRPPPASGQATRHGRAAHRSSLPPPVGTCWLAPRRKRTHLPRPRPTAPHEYPHRNEARSVSSIPVALYYARLSRTYLLRQRPALLCPECGLCPCWQDSLTRGRHLARRSRAQ